MIKGCPNKKVYSSNLLKIQVIKFSFIILAIISVISIYLHGTIQHLKIVNINMEHNDQSAYMKFARKIYESKYSYSGTRCRMPVYPFIQSLFYRSGMDDQEFFILGKYVNIILSLLILFFIFLILNKYLSPFYVLNLLLITSFSIFMFKAAYFHSALLFYFLFFLSFLLMCKILLKPTLKWSAITGIVLGVTHLTKAAILPGVLLLLFFLIVKLLRFAYSTFFNTYNAIDMLQYRNKIFHQLICLVLVGISFIVTIGPYILESKRTFGRYFYNVNSTFYIWCDSWEEVVKTTRAHKDRRGWPDMPPELIPSPKKYFREHSIQQVYNRFVKGFNYFMKPCYDYGYFKYFYIYLIFCIFLTIVVGRLRKNKMFFIKHGLSSLFSFSYFIIYLLLYAWYAIVSPGNRMLLSLFLPFMFSVSIVIKEYTKEVFITFKNHRVNILTIFNYLILFIFIVDLFSFIKRVSQIYAGS